MKEKIEIIGDIDEHERRYATISYSGAIFYYFYSAGKNFEAESNKQYENILFIEENKLGERAFSGTYLRLTEKKDKYTLNEMSAGVLIPLDIYDVINGQIIRSRTITLNINSREWRKDYSGLYNGPMN